MDDARLEAMRSDDAPAWITLAEAIVESKPALAARIARRAADVVSDPIGLYNCALILDRVDDAAGADALYAKVLVLAPGDKEAALNRARLLRAQGRSTEAEEVLKALVKQHPGFAPAFGNYGNLLFACGRLVEAENNYRRALQIDPRFVDVLRNYAQLLEQSGRAVEAADQRRSMLRYAHGLRRTFVTRTLVVLAVSTAFSAVALPWSGLPASDVLFLMPVATVVLGGVLVTAFGYLHRKARGSGR